MTATITIWSNKTIATIGLLFFSSIFLIAVANAQCDASPSITIDQSEVEITPFGNTFCWIDIPYRIVNPGPCDMSDFMMFFSVTTPEGTENIVHNITGPLAPNTPFENTIGFPSVLLKSNKDGSCYEVSDIVIMTMLSTLNPPSAITQEIDCPFGNGTITVCANDQSIICDESNCVPFVCTGDVSAEIQTAEVVFTTAADGNCNIEIPYILTSNGNCDVGIFNLDITITTARGTETISESISGISTSSTVNGSIQFNSLIITDDNGVCLDPSEIEITASIPMQGDIITTTVPCPSGNGTIEVCSNNPLIVCDDSNCIPFTCETNVSMMVELENLFINELPSGVCELTIPYVGENLGDCDVSGFNIEIIVSSPNGSQVFELNQAGPIAAGSTFNNSFGAESAILSSPGISCFDLSEINVSISISDSAQPTPITTMVDCPDGLGTIEVCANNQTIVCDESLCELLLPLDLVSLTGKADENRIVLHWETAFEIDNENFLIQHSVDGKSFETIGEVASHGESHELANYEYIHNDAPVGDNYYRLIATDINGYQDYSKTIIINLEYKKLNLRISPNPTADLITLDGLSDFSESLKANVYTADGQLKLSLDVRADSNKQQFDISELPSGLYFLSLREGNFVQNLKLIKL